MKSTTFRFLAVLIAALGLAWTIDAQAGSVPAVGAAPPEIHAGGWINATGDVSLAAEKGHVVVVEFWATWCPPCRASIPHLEETFKDHQKDGLVVIGLSDEAKDKVEPFAAKMGMTYIVGYESKTIGDYGVDSIPRAFIVGKDGKLAWTGHPMLADFKTELDKALAAQ